MDLTTTAYGTWSGGRFMHFGETLDEERFLNCIRTAYDSGVRTFLTSDVYGAGRADKFLGEALSDKPRDSYCLVGMVGHDFYNAERQGSKGFPRFCDPALRGEDEYADFLKFCTEKSLENCGTDHFDLLMLHNPGERGFSNDKVWEAMETLRSAKLTERLGIAPGPANGFTLDLIHAFEQYGSSIDWAMIILNPNEPWPGQLVLPAAEKFGVDLLTRVVDHGGIFHDDIKPGHELKPGDHRAFRPDGWIEHGNEKMEQMRPIADKYGISMIELACIWNLSQSPVKSVTPTFIQEQNEGARPIEEKIKNFGKLSDIRLTSEEVKMISKIGDNTGCMTLKGASQRHATSERPDEWPMRPELLEVAERYELAGTW